MPSTQNAEQPKPDSKLATSAGTATGLKPDDWKARTEQDPQGQQRWQAGRSLAAERSRAAKSIANRADTEPPGRPISPQEAKAHKEHHESGRLWIADGNFVRPVPVRIIATDGTMTEVRGKDLSEGMEVVIGENIASDADSGDAPIPSCPSCSASASKPKGSGSSK